MDKENENVNKPSYSNHFAYRDGSYISVIWRAADDNKKSFDEENMQKTFLSLLGDKNTAPEMITAAPLFKRVFKDYLEKELRIELGQSGKQTHRVKYCHGELTEYSHCFALDHQEYEARYTDGVGLSFVGRTETVKDEEGYLEKMEPVLYHPMLTEKIEEEVELIDWLAKFDHHLSLTQDHDSLCKAYYLFFRENPNFSDLESVTKAHAMSGILEGLYIPIGTDFFMYLDDDEKQVSPKTSDMIEDLKCLGEIDASVISVPFKAGIEKRIVDIGRITCKWMKKSPENDITELSTHIYERDKSTFQNPDVKFKALSNPSITRCLSDILKVTKEE